MSQVQPRIRGMLNPLISSFAVSSSGFYPASSFRAPTDLSAFLSFIVETDTRCLDQKVRLPENPHVSDLGRTGLRVIQVEMRGRRGTQSRSLREPM